MDKKTTVNVVGGDDTLEICKAIVKTHEYCIMNLDILSHHERGYMFNEYFPAVKRHLDPVEVLVPCLDSTGKEAIKKVIKEMEFKGDSVGKHYKKFGEPERKVLTDTFKQVRDDGQPLFVSLSNIPHAILNVRVARSTEAERIGHFWCLEPVKLWTVNTITGIIDFMEDVDTIAIMDYLKVNSDYYIFVDYVAKDKPGYEAGTDGED